jgi:tRNA/rRNA methyltransferase
MAGTDHTRAGPTSGPVIVLVRPQLGENIGAAARAMLNFGLVRMRLVAPRDGWPDPKAEAMASGATEVIDRAKIFETAEAAIADLRFVMATTARDRAVLKPVRAPREAAAELSARSAAGYDIGILFGAERSGLTNEEIALADEVLTIPANPAFSSLNLAQAVLLMGYEWFAAQEGAGARRDAWPGAEPATRDDLLRLFEHLEEALDRSGFLYPPEKRPSMVLNLRALLHRAQLTDQEVRTLRGVIGALERSSPPRAEN